MKSSPMNKKKLIIIAGPTATGKSDLSIDIASEYQLPIVNADSLLFYRELNIGVAKPRQDDRKKVPHYLIDVASINEPLNAKTYRDLAEETMNELWKKYQGIILCGGSGFYIRALINGMYDSVTTDPEILDRSNKLYLIEGIKPFQDILQSVDQETFQKLHPNDHYRIRRAVEHWWMTQIPLSQASSLQAEKNNTFPYWQEQGWEILYLYTDIPKDIHHEIIIKRTQLMLKNGLINEVKDLLKIYSGKEKPLQSIGYKEVQDYLMGKITSDSELIEKIVISTRQLAKAQRTWFANVEKISLSYPNFIMEAKRYINNFLNYSRT
jgi:tRNA dimethylallyltransferase